jgi:hypothetical protein
MPLKCPQCSYANRSGSRFCRRCGHDLAKPGSPANNRATTNPRVERGLDRTALVYVLAFFFFAGSIAFLFVHAAGVDSTSALASGITLPILLVFTLLHLAWQRRTAELFDALGYVFIQKSVHIGWLAAALAVLTPATSQLWLPLIVPLKPANAPALTAPIAIALAISALYGFMVRWQVDHRLFAGLVEDLPTYRSGVVRTSFLMLAGFVFAVMAMLSGITAASSTTKATALIGTFLACAIAMWLFLFISALFHVPIALAILANRVRKRAVEIEGIFFLGEPLKRFQKIIPDACNVDGGAIEKVLGDYRGALKRLLREAIVGIAAADITTAKIPVPAAMNLRFGEKEVHKYIQVTLPTHAGIIKIFISLRSIGVHAALGCSMYFLGEESMVALKRNGFRILRIYCSGLASTGGAPNTVRNGIADDDLALPVTPRLKPSAEMDMLGRADRDEIVDEAAGALWLAILESMRRFESALGGRKVEKGDDLR